MIEIDREVIDEKIEEIKKTSEAFKKVEESKRLYDDVVKECGKNAYEVVRAERILNYWDKKWSAEQGAIIIEEKKRFKSSLSEDHILKRLDRMQSEIL